MGKRFDIQYEENGATYSRTATVENKEAADKVAKNCGKKGAKVTGEVLYSESTDLDKKFK